MSSFLLRDRLVGCLGDRGSLILAVTFLISRDTEHRNEVMLRIAGGDAEAADVAL